MLRRINKKRRLIINGPRRGSPRSLEKYKKLRKQMILGHNYTKTKTSKRKTIKNHKRVNSTSNVFSLSYNIHHYIHRNKNPFIIGKRRMVNVQYNIV